MAFVTYTLAREGLIHTRHADRRRGIDGRVDRQSRASRRRAGLEAGGGKRRHRHAPPGERSVPGRRRDAARRRAISAAPCSRPARSTRSAGSIEAPARCFSDQNEVLEAFKAGELDRDVRRRRPLPGAARQRHARAAQADADARRASGPRPPGRADHRRAHVGRERQGARRDPCFARSAARRPARPGPRRRPDPARCRNGHARSGRRRPCRAAAGQFAAAAGRAPGASCSR